MVQVGIAGRMLLAFSALTGLAYPLTITGIARLVFAKQAGGSLIVRDGQVVGSELIGQPFDDPAYVWGRPSATARCAYDAAASRGSNLAVTSPAQRELIAARVRRLRASGIAAQAPIPVDLVAASGSGLDPHISPAAARLQAARVAQARGQSEARVRQLIEEHTRHRHGGVLGTPVVNVLALNLALDQLAPAAVEAAPR